MGKDRIELLMDIISDPEAQDHEKDDAAMDLADLEDDRALSVLISVAQSPSENDLFALDTYGETIAVIWMRQNIFPKHEYQTLNASARYGIFRTIKHKKPEWVKRFDLEKDNFKD